MDKECQNIVALLAVLKVELKLGPRRITDAVFTIDKIRKELDKIEVFVLTNSEN